MRTIPGPAPAPAPGRGRFRRRLAHLGRLLGAGLFLAGCGTASYTAGARHRTEPVADRTADLACLRHDPH